MTNWHGGKGSAPRKGDDQKTYEDNWERIFNSQHKEIDEMAVKLKRSQTTYDQKTGKRTTEHFYLKCISEQDLHDLLDSPSTKPKIQQRIRNEITRRKK